MRKINPLAKTLWNLFKVILALVLIGFVFSKTNLTEIIALIKGLSPAWLLTSLVLFCGLTLVKAFQYHALTGRQVPYARILYVVIAQNAVSNFIAGSAGIASYLTMLSMDEGIKFRKVLAAFFIAKMGDLLAVWIALFVSSLLLGPRISAIQGAVILLLVIILGVVAVFLAVVLLRRKFVRVIRSILLWMKIEQLQFVQRALSFLQFFAEQDGALIMRNLLIGLAYSLIYLGLTLLWFYSNLRAYSLVFSFPVIIFVDAFIQLLSWIPVQVFGGLGISETSIVYLFGLFGLPAAQAAAIGIGFRLILYLFTLVLLLYLPLNSLRRRSARESIEIKK